MAVIQNALSAGANHPRKLYGSNLGWVFSAPQYDCTAASGPLFCSSLRLVKV
jgi:hypothetical protein